MKDVIGSSAISSLEGIKSKYRTPIRTNLIIVFKTKEPNFIKSLQKVIQSRFISIKSENEKDDIYMS
jgi:hypothetical protein